ncbi:MAG: hypothetical protein A7316_04120 [Candidatus Altiarchaeales archaeon WOR_SM1_86-2]|nr:MAG: hypothetical protein A7316_04120 [Candidatus Altiarchaeales archaeon WOR_SM1_86-2]ODS40006.1 MAG: hypothetical protein A7315_09875 [Candidatus Altiarchaeales archaeon WOR_SM1_79]
MAVDDDELEILDEKVKKAEKSALEEVIDLEEYEDVVGRIDFPTESERVVIKVKCATTERNYEVSFAKQLNDFYEVFDIKEAKGKESGYELYEPHESGLTKHDASKFNWDGVECPYCYGRFPDEHKYGAKTNVLQCMSCGRMSCGGSIKSRGRTMYFKCPWCGKGGIIGTEPFEDFSIPFGKKGKKK